MAAMAGKVVKQLAGSGTGQSLMDRVNQAKHSIAGSGLGKHVCKATTEEMIPPKKKHLDYLIQCSHEPNVSIPSLADHMLKRTQEWNWVIVFKSLITLHNLMNFGNERLCQYLASNSVDLCLPGFTDKNGVQAYDMSLLIRAYAKYMNEKRVSYGLMAFDFCKIKRGDDGVLRTMNIEKLLKALPVLQGQLDVLFEFEANESELANPIVKTTFMLIYKDLIRLFASYNEGMINLIEKYFTLNKKQCRDSLELYKKFVTRMEKVIEFLDVAEKLGCGEKDSLGLKPVPERVLETMEQHLASLEGRKVTKSTSGESKVKGDQAAASSPTSDTPADPVSESERAKIVEEERRRLTETSTRSNAAAATPVKVQPTRNTGPTVVTVGASKPSDDLLNWGSDDDDTEGAAQPVSTFNPFATIEDTDTYPIPENKEVDFEAFGVKPAAGDNCVKDPSPMPSPTKHEATHENNEVAPTLESTHVRSSTPEPDHQQPTETTTNFTLPITSNNNATSSNTLPSPSGVQKGRTPTTTAPVIGGNLDDIFGLDLLGGSDVQLTVTPTPAQVIPVSPVKPPEPAKQKPSSGLEDIFGLDPLIGGSSWQAPVSPAKPTNSLDTLLQSKPASSTPLNIPRGSAAQPSNTNKNALDLLDSSLASLAGSLSSSPGQTRWVQGQQTKQPISSMGSTNMNPSGHARGPPMNSMGQVTATSNTSNSASKPHDPFDDLMS